MDINKKETVKKRSTPTRLLAVLAAVWAAGFWCAACPAQALSAPAPLSTAHVKEAIEGVESLLQSRKSRSSRPEFELTVAVSLALHPDYLAELAHAVSRIGGRLVVRGVPASRRPDARHPHAYFSLASKEQAAVKADALAGFKRLAQSTAPAGAAIDPLFFRRHAIDSVPVFAVSWVRADGASQEKRTALVRGRLTADAAL